MLTTRLDFAALRRRASFETVLDHYGLKLIRAGTHWFILCPFHRESTPSCSVHLAKRIFHCFGCSAGGTIIDFVAMMEQINFQSAAAKLGAICEIEKQEYCEKPPVQLFSYDRCNQADRRDSNPPLKHPLSLDPTHPYLRGRGLSPEVLEQFGLGYCNRGLMRGHICIPIHDAEGNLVAYAGRWASDTIPAGIPRYLLPATFPKRHVLFNLHRIGHSNHVVLVEGYWSVFRLHSLSIPVAGLMGSEISPEQVALLVERNTRLITLLMDGDRGGRGGQQKITPLLAERFWVFAPPLPNGEKPNSVTELYLSDLKNRFSNCRP